MTTPFTAGISTKDTSQYFFFRIFQPGTMAKANYLADILQKIFFVYYFNLLKSYKLWLGTGPNYVQD